MSILTKIMGIDKARERMAEAETILENNRQAANALSVPEIAAPENYNYIDLGGYDPEFIQTTGGAPQDLGFNLGDAAQSTASTAADSRLAGAVADPRLEIAQMDSLAGLQDLSQTGMSAQDQADLSRVLSQSAQQDRGRRDAILQNAGARGMSSGGNELLAQLTSSQAATDRSNQAGLDIAGQAGDRRMVAMTAGGAMAGDIRGQQFGEAAQKALAQDAINKFNANISTNVNMANTGAKNDVNQARAVGSFGASAANVNNAMRYNDNRAAINAQNAGIQNAAAASNNANAQTLANLNTVGQNTSAAAVQGAKQQNYDNQVTKAGIQTGAADALAGSKSGNAAITAGMYGHSIDAIIKGGTAAATKDKK